VASSPTLNEDSDSDSAVVWV